MTLTATKDKVVSIHYTLKNEEGEVIDSSDGAEPLVYLHGHGQIVRGLENKLSDKKVGDELSAEIGPEDGYGWYDDSLELSVPRKQFPAGATIDVGAIFEFSSDDNDPMLVRVISVSDDVVKVDGNHPLAGKKLFFEVEVVGIRDATESEIAHGHAHGEDGEHHHH